MSPSPDVDKLAYFVSCMAYNHSAKTGDYHYELTECDLENGRWRVRVPSYSLCADTTPSPAKRIDNCRISCEAGYYFDLGDLTCRMCRPGTFSLGGGVLFDTWEDLPQGFYTQVDRYGWQPSGDFLASLGGPCAATLTYTVHLVKPGNLSYVYQYSDKDVIFDFELSGAGRVSSLQTLIFVHPCSLLTKFFNSLTDHQAQNDQCQSIGDSKEYRWPSATRKGEWKQQTVHLKTGQNVLQWKTIGMDTHQAKPVLIKAIEISGVDFTSSCNPCRPGTYSQGGARSCMECPENHFSPREASTCTSCNNLTEFAPRASANCLTRKMCTRKDYYETRTPCDANNQTRQVFKWLQPKICRDDIKEAVQLPTASENHECPPCNPGMDYGNSSKCEFCPRNTFSDGRAGCKNCPPNTTPNYGYQIIRWTEMPQLMSAACMEPDGSSCSSSMGWQCGGSFIHSGHHHTDGAYLLLSLNVAGFRSKGGVMGGHRLEVGSITFSFQLDCKSKCEFVFMQGSETKGVSLIQSWTESQSRQEFTHIIMQNDSYTFSWAFQKLKLGQDPMDAELDDDVAKIFSINITNTIDGGAAVCLPCHQELEDRGCIPCPSGQYIDPNTTACTPCPPDTTVSDPLAYGEDSCKACGPGLSSFDGVSCTTKCIFTLDGTQYDLRSLTNQWTKEDLILSTQSVTLGDELIGVAKDISFMNIETINEFVQIGFKDDLHFFYSTPLSTRSCPQGRTTVITLHCDPSKKDNGTIQLPSRCPDGTCDGCNFNFLWASDAACPVCTESDFKTVKGECVNGLQMIHYLPPSHCLVKQSMPTTKNIPCTTHIPLELQAVIAVTIALAIFLCGLMIYFWKKTQRLEYKYMKLVQSSGGRDEVELPPAESCALDDGEEEEIQFNQPRATGILNRIKAMTGKVQ
uniref:MRH domain-containing protein n=1 Tax=Timema monikensis TaxID=170555 RepID=A0A7R9E9A5_9NEOP|nr:unnamed protein product [Timema monikensis]